MFFSPLTLAGLFYHQHNTHLNVKTTITTFIKLCVPRSSTNENFFKDVRSQDENTASKNEALDSTKYFLGETLIRKQNREFTFHLIITEHIAFILTNLKPNLILLTKINNPRPA